MKKITLFKRISQIERINFTRNLGVMLGTGLPLSTALKILSKQSRKELLKEVLIEVRKDIRSGSSLFDSLSKHPKVFSRFYLNMVNVGEEGGTLKDSLVELAKQMKKTHRLKSKVKGALIYPAVIFVTMIVIGIIMMLVIVPRLNVVFLQFKLTLPITTRIIITISELLSTYLIFTIPVVIFLFLLARFYLKKPLGQRFSYKLIMALPVVGSLHKQLNAGLFARNLSSMVNSGVSIAKALRTTADTHKNIFYQNSLIRASQEVKKGRPLYEIMNEYPELYPPMVTEILEVGEETGELTALLEHLASFYEEEIDQTTNNLSVIIEPALLIFVGVAVGFFAISMLQPMYSLLEGFN